MKNVVLQVTYVDYQNRKHLHFCQNKEDYQILKMNYDIKDVLAIPIKSFS